MAVHEFGHVLAAWITGGVVSKVVLHPLEMSRTDLSYNPRPLFVAWAGPMLGALLPLGMWAAARAARSEFTFLLRWFSGFCLVANGVYIGAGAFNEVGDAGDMLFFGSEKWQLVAFGIVCAPAGFAIWNGLGKDFGWGESQGRVNKKTAIVSAALLVLVAALEFALSPRSV